MEPDSLISSILHTNAVLEWMRFLYRKNIYMYIYIYIKNT